MQTNLPGLLFLAKIVVMEGTSLGFFQLAIVYPRDYKFTQRYQKGENLQLLLPPVGEIPNYFELLPAFEFSPAS